MTWPIVPLGELGTGPSACAGGPFGSELTTRDYVESPGVPVIRGANLGEAGFIDDGFVYVSLEKAATLSLNQALPGDVVFTQRGTIGQVAMIPLRPRFERYIISQSQMKLTPDLERIEPRYLVHYFRSPSALRLLKQNTLATGVPHINLTILRRIPVPMPSLAEQQRIADLLDKAETIRRKRQEAIALTDDLLRSTFLEMFGDLSQWPTRPFAELVSESLLGLVRAAAEQGPDRAHPYVRMNAIRPDGALDLTNLTRVDASAAEAERYRLYAGDFLFNTRNSRELVGKSAVYHPDGDEPIVFNNNILRIRFSPDVLPDFVSSYWQTAMATRELEKRKAGTTSVFAIYFKNLATLPVPVPPLSIQRAYTRACEASRTLQREYRSHAAASATLTSRLQRDAFER